MASGVRRAGGNAFLHKRLLKRFLESAGDSLPLLSLSPDSGEARAEILLRLHTIKGTASTLGAVRVAAAAEMEASLKGRPDAVLHVEELAAPHFSGEMREVEEHLDGLDFEAALLALNSLESKLKGGSTSP